MYSRWLCCTLVPFGRVRVFEVAPGELGVDCLDIAGLIRAFWQIAERELVMVLFTVGAEQDLCIVYCR